MTNPKPQQQDGMTALLRAIRAAPDLSADDLRDVAHWHERTLFDDTHPDKPQPPRPPAGGLLGFTPKRTLLGLEGLRRGLLGWPYLLAVMELLKDDPDRAARGVLPSVSPGWTPRMRTYAQRLMTGLLGLRPADRAALLEAADRLDFDQRRVLVHTLNAVRMAKVPRPGPDAHGHAVTRTRTVTRVETTPEGEAVTYKVDLLYHYWRIHVTDNKGITRGASIYLYSGQRGAGSADPDGFACAWEAGLVDGHDVETAFRAGHFEGVIRLRGYVDACFNHGAQALPEGWRSDFELLL